MIDPGDSCQVSLHILFIFIRNFPRQKHIRLKKLNKYFFDTGIA